MTKLFKVSIEQTNMGIINNLSNRLDPMLQKAVTAASRELTWFVKRQYLSGPKSNLTIRNITGGIYRKTVPLPTTIEGDSILGGMQFGETPYTGIHIGPMGQRTVIRPRKTGGALAIPTDAALTSSGRRKSQFSTGNLRDVKGLYRKGSALFMKGSKNPMFILRRSVTLQTKVFPEIIAIDYTTNISFSVQRALDNFFKGKFA